MCADGQFPWHKGEMEVKMAQYQRECPNGYKLNTVMPCPYTQVNTMPQYPLPVISPTGYPTGIPLGPPTAPFPVPSQMTPPASNGILADEAIMPQTVVNTQYTAGFLRTQIGKRVRVDFLVGTSSLTDRTGILIGVGASYILLQSLESNSVTMCDLYSIKFVAIFQ
jgi:hypothetical protein